MFFSLLHTLQYTLYIYSLHFIDCIIILSKRNTVYNNTGYNTRLLSRYCFACRTCTIHNPRSRLYHCTRESVYSAVYIYIYVQGQFPGLFAFCIGSLQDIWHFSVLSWKKCMPKGSFQDVLESAIRIQW